MLCKKAKQMQAGIYTREGYVAQQARFMHVHPTKSNLTMLRRERDTLKNNRETFTQHKNTCNECKNG